MTTKLYGIILIDKPKGMTSHAVISRLRAITGIRKIGHAGTLDPMATGLLIVAVGRESTKTLNTYLKQDKIYTATLMLGKNSDTYDAEGKITEVSDVVPTQESIIDCLKHFTGTLLQTPPMFSAKKVQGKKLYELARKGITIERKACEITIHNIKLVAYKYPQLTCDVHCSSGTYIRSLAYDIGEYLKTGAYLTELRRTQIGEFMIDRAHKLDSITSQNWQNLLF